MVVPADSDNSLIEQVKPEIADQFSVPPAIESQDFNYESFDNNGGEGEEAPTEEATLFRDFKDGSSDSDSSAIMNEDYSPTAAIYSPGVLHNLKLSYETLHQDNQALLKEVQLQITRTQFFLFTNIGNAMILMETVKLCLHIRELKAKLQEDNSESNLSMEEEMVVPADSENSLIEQVKPEIADQFTVPPAIESQGFNYESFDNNGGEGEEAPTEKASLFRDFKDGSSDSDSSAILNEDYSPTAAILNHHHHHFMTAASPSPSAAVKLNCVTTTLSYLQYQKGYRQTQMFPKMEEHNFFSREEACNFFSDEQAPTL